MESTIKEAVIRTEGKYTIVHETSNKILFNSFFHVLSDGDFMGSFLDLESAENHLSSLIKSFGK